MAKAKAKAKAKKKAKKKPKPWNRKKQNNFTAKERKLIKFIADGMTVKDAAKKAGYAESTTTSAIYQEIRKPKMQTAMQMALRKAGIHEDKIAEKVAEGLDAHKVISANIIANNGEGMKDAHSMTKDFVEVPDFMARHKHLETAIKLHDLFPNQRVDLTVDQRRPDTIPDAELEALIQSEENGDQEMTG